MNHGSRFTVEVQVEKQVFNDVQPLYTPQKVIGIGPDEEGNEKQLGLLIADDIEDNRQVLHKLLAPLGVKISEANNGKEAIELWKEWHALGCPPDLIWMDIRMPVMDGYEATKVIRKLDEAEGHRTVIIAVSASAFDQDSEVFLTGGFDDFINKPFKEHEILEKMGKYLRLNYVFERKDNKSDQYSLKMHENVASELSMLPPEWKRAMHEAVELSDHEKMNLLTSQIQEKYSGITYIIQKEIDQFNYDEILNIFGKK